MEPGFEAIRRDFLAWLDKEWSTEFFESRKPVGELRPHVDDLREWDPTNNYVQLFMEAYEDDIAFNEALQFCQHARPSDFDKQSLSKSGSAWLDDRTNPSNFQNNPQNVPQNPTPDVVRPHHMIPHREIDEHMDQQQPAPNSEAISFSNKDLNFRKCKGPLTAQALYDRLRVKRFDHGQLPDADRRLIYVANPDQYDILALTETASRHQHPALRDAIWKHVACETALTVNISTDEWPVFRLELHVPFYVLKIAPSVEKYQAKSQKPNRGWIDLSFLSNRRLVSKVESKLHLHQAHISFVICGSDETRWIAYCFEDTDFDDDREMSEYEFSLTGMQVDQISNGKLDANRPIWNPREYFLSIVRIRISQILQEWRKVVRVIEARVGNNSPGCLFSSRSIHTTQKAVDSFEDSDWTNETLKLIFKLRQTLSETNSVLEQFLAAKGDRAYFYDLMAASREPRRHIQRALQHINEAFDELKRLETRVFNLEQKCEKLAGFIAFRLSIESNRTATRSGSNAELTILYISPLAIVSSFFAIPTPIMSFERNALSFFIGVLLFTLILNMLLIMKEKKLRHHPQWVNFVTRIKAAYGGDPEITTKDSSGVKVLRRRSTYVSFGSNE